MINKYNLIIKDELNNQWIDIDIDNVDFSTVFSIDDIKDIEKRKDNYTKDIVINGTAHNNLILGRLYDLSRYVIDGQQSTGYNFQPNKYIHCQLYENNIQLITGKLLIKDVVVKGGVITYNAVIVGNVISFFQDIKDKELTDLNSINDVVTWSLPNIIDSWTGGYEIRKYVYPSIDYGIDERKGNYNTWDNTVDIKNYRPATRLKYILLSIFRGWRLNTNNNSYTQFDEFGNKLNKYTVTSTLFDDVNFERIIIPATDIITKKVNKKVTFTFSGQTISSTSILKGVFLLNNGGDNEYYSTPYSPNFTYLNINGTTKYTGNNYTHTILTLDSGIQTSVRIQTSVTLSQNTTGTFHIGLCDISDGNNEITLNNMKWYTTINKTGTLSSQTYVIDYSINEAVDITGQYIMAYVREDQTTNNIINTTIIFNEVVVTFGDDNYLSTYPVTMFDTLPLYTTLPTGVKIIDFLKSVMLMFNLYLYKDPTNENAYKLETYNDFYSDIINNNYDNAIDWSGKIDSSNYKLLTNIDLPSSYVYKYVEDEDMVNQYYNERYGKQYGERTITNSNGTGDAKEIEVIFAPTINVSTSLNNKSIPYLCQADSFFSGEKKPYQSKIRLLYWNGKKNTSSYSTHYRGADIQSISNYGHSSMLKLDTDNSIVASLFFGLPSEFFGLPNEIVTSSAYTLYDRYHYNQLKDINNPNLMIMEADILLNENDINNLDFSIPIFIENRFGGAYWKLLELEYKNNYSISKVKLQKIV